MTEPILTAVREALAMARQMSLVAKDHPLWLVEVTRELFDDTIVRPLATLDALIAKGGRPAIRAIEAEAVAAERERIADLERIECGACEHPFAAHVGTEGRCIWRFNANEDVCDCNAIETARMIEADDALEADHD